MNFYEQDQNQGIQYQDQNQFIPYPVQPFQSPISDSTIISQTNPNSMVQELRRKLKCEIEVIDPETKQPKWEKMEGIKPMMNDQGINSVMADVHGLVNQLTVLSNISEEDASNLTIELGKTLTYKLAMNWKEFEVDKSNLSTIVLIITNMAYMASRRGMDQGERIFLKTAVRTTENIISRPMERQNEDRPWWRVWK